MSKSNKFILWFNEIGIQDVPLVGGKNASLGEMYRNLTKKKVNVPNGFAVTAYAYDYFMEEEKLNEKIKKILGKVNPNSIQSLTEKGRETREVILKSDLPPPLRIEIINAYRKLSKKYGKNTDVAVRSSATAEDLPDASFAGQQETYLNIRGEHALMDACKKCFASLFTNRAIHYRIDKGFDHFKVALSIGVQKMVRSDLSSSGVMFSIDTETGFKDVVLINGIYGLGENIVQGAVNPDEFYVFKPTLKKGFKPILKKTIGNKKMRMVYSHDSSKHTTKNVYTTDEERKSFVISEDEILKLAKWACIVEDHYKKPMDLEWAKDGKTKQLFIVQARPETVQSQKDNKVLEEYKIQKKGKVIAQGRSVGAKIGQGRANVIKDVHGINKFKPGEVLVTDMTDPDWEPIMKIASGIVTNRGGRTCFDGNTKILTNKGFMTLKNIHENGYGGLLTLSFNKNTKKTEWKPIIASMKREAQRIQISTSQTGRIKDNTLTITSDHKMVNIRDAEIVDTKIREMLEKEEMICIAQKIPSLEAATEKDKKFAYLLGGIMTDGSIYRSRTHGEVQFIQKNTPEKKQFIRHMQNCMAKVYNKGFVPFEKKYSTGIIRGKEVRGQATAYRLYSKQIAYEMHEQEQSVVTTLLKGSIQLSYSFLAGVIDGDGSFFNNRIQIYISEQKLLEAVVTSCLRIGIVPQVTKNRNVFNVQIVEKLSKILSYTKRVKGQVNERTIKTRFFAAKQLLKESLKGQYKLRINKNLYISEEELKKINSEKISILLSSDLRMHRAINTGFSDYGEVYNITVADNHTYTVFTEKLTPVIVNNCHAAIISRELGIPCIVGTNDATTGVKNNQKVTVSCAEGEAGFVYDNFMPFKVDRHNLKHLKKPNTKVMLNVGNPEQAFEHSFLPNEGVGLAREEFIINEYIKIHPKALIRFNQIRDKDVRNKIEGLTPGYKDKSKFFIDKLAQGVATIAAAFYPKDVIVRMSDFKSNEYANLIGGKLFEPTEHNPMIGWRGASRYYSDYKDAFALECKAMIKVREVMGLNNVKLMIPFCRTVEEGKKVLKEMEKNGLKRGKNKLEVYVMCEIPSNVILADEFAEIFDGFSIGTNDLTQLTLGLDRDSELVSDVYDERNQAVKNLVATVIKKAKANKKKIGLCGEAGSIPEFARFLAECGIDSVSVVPDAAIKTALTLLEQEKKLKKKH
ncbi:MAG: phosphoenolpyruvate synthase [Nanoarchaeota archaeon]|nr:phosphoenolpyruvate synthase [Nanoarchaeota archaeon]